MEEIIKVNTGQVDLDKLEETQKVHDANLAIAAKANPDNPILKPFDNQTGIANFGHGSLASLLGFNVKDLDANVRSGTTQSSKAEDNRPSGEGIPILRYINLPGARGAYEIKRYMSGRITASKTLDGVNFHHVITSNNALDVLMALTDRSLQVNIIHKESAIQYEDAPLAYDTLGSGTAIGQAIDVTPMSSTLDGQLETTSGESSTDETKVKIEE